MLAGTVNAAQARNTPRNIFNPEKVLPNMKKKINKQTKKKRSVTCSGLFHACEVKVNRLA